MQKEEFKITWVSSKEKQPQVGITCPKCEHGFLKRSKYPEGVPEDMKDVYCPVCKWKWRISTSKISGTQRILREFDQGEMLKNGQRVIIENQKIIIGLLKKIKENIDS